MDIERRLDRLECRITQYIAQEDEEIIPVVQVVQKAAAVLECQTPPVIADVSVSGN